MAVLTYALGLNRNSTRIEKAMLAALVIAAVILLTSTAAADGFASHLAGLDLGSSTDGSVDQLIAYWESV